MPDVFVEDGEEELADYLDGTKAVPGTWYGHWGTGSTAATKADAALVTPGSEARVACTMSKPATDTNRFVWQITADGAKTISEAGIFDALTVGRMICRSNFTGIVLALNDAIEFTADLQHG